MACSRRQTERDGVSGVVGCPLDVVRGEGLAASDLQVTVIANPCLEYPRSMGIDMLDLVFRLESQFHVAIEWEPLDRVAQRFTPPDLTAGDVHYVVCGICRDAGVAVPASSWHRVKLAILHSCHNRVSPTRITPHTRLVAELGFT